MRYHVEQIGSSPDRNGGVVVGESDDLDTARAILIHHLGVGGGVQLVENAQDKRSVLAWYDAAGNPRAQDV